MDIQAATSHDGHKLAALATIRMLCIEHGETFVASCLAGVLFSRVLVTPIWAVGVRGRVHMTRERALRIVKAIG